MKKKTIALVGVAALAGLSLASCQPEVPGPSGDGNTQTRVNHTYALAPENYQYETALANNELDIYVNYSGKEGITYRGATAFSNVVDKQNYTEGALLPTWKAFQTNLNLVIRDASGYTTQKDDDTHSKVTAAGFVSDSDKNQKIDLYYNTTKNIDKLGTSDQAVNLLEHLDKMPNFKKFLEESPTIKATLEAGHSGKIYYTPYFDGYNDVERMFIMDSAIAAKVLDAETFDGFDTTTNGAGAAANVVQAAAFTPFIHETKNYPNATTKISILTEDTVVVEIEVKQTDNIIAQQNELLKAGCTGKALAEQFRNYLQAAYGDYVGTGDGKYFANYSDIFCSESAAYNTDELIALLRVIKANPGLITGDPTAEVETIFPRGQAHNRVDNMADFLQIFGVQGMTSEKEMLYFSADGKLNTAATTQATYDAVKKLSQMYDEGLILGEFWYKPGTTSGTAYLDRFFKKTADGAGYGFMMYDYSAANCAANDMVDGIGTDSSKRKIAYETTGIKPVLPPVTYWANTADWSVSQPLNDFTGKTLMRYAEENRSLKGNSWCIPTTSDNVDAALRLMDYMFSDLGAMIQDFGPTEYWQVPDLQAGDTLAQGLTAVETGKAYCSTDIVSDELTPIISDTLKIMIKDQSGGRDFWSFMRAIIGSTHGIGCERSKGLDIQACNAHGQVGLIDLKQAIAAGVVELALVDKVKGQYTWHTTVPTSGYTAPNSDAQKAYEAVTAFWASDKNHTDAIGWVALVKENSANDMANVACGQTASSVAYKYSDVLAQVEQMNKVYLYSMANSLGADCIPDYAKQN